MDYSNKPDAKRKNPPFGGVVDTKSRCVTCAPVSDLEAGVPAPAAAGPVLSEEEEMLRRLGNTVQQRLERHYTKERKKNAGRKRKERMMRNLGPRQLREVIDGVLKTMMEAEKGAYSQILEGMNKAPSRDEMRKILQNLPVNSIINLYGKTVFNLGDGKFVYPFPTDSVVTKDELAGQLEDELKDPSPLREKIKKA